MLGSFSFVRKIDGRSVFSVFLDAEFAAEAVRMVFLGMMKEVGFCCFVLSRNGLKRKNNLWRMKKKAYIYNTGVIFVPKGPRLRLRNAIISCILKVGLGLPIVIRIIVRLNFMASLGTPHSIAKKFSLEKGIRGVFF